MTSGLQVLAGEALLEELSECMPRRVDFSLGRCLVVDADRTLCFEDTGRLVGNVLGVNESIRLIFEKHGYKDEAFMAASDIWSSINKEIYISSINYVVEGIKLRKCWDIIFDSISKFIPVIVVTAGIPQVWNKILANAGRSKIPILGGCYLGMDRYVVSASSKENVVKSLQNKGWMVIAAGDSLIDFPMLAAADIALFVPDEKGSPALREVISKIPSARHLLVDNQCFDELLPCTTQEAIELILHGGV